MGDLVLPGYMLVGGAILIATIILYIIYFISKKNIIFELGLGLSIAFLCYVVGIVINKFISSEFIFILPNIAYLIMIPTIIFFIIFLVKKKFFYTFVILASIIIIIGPLFWIAIK